MKGGPFRGAPNLISGKSENKIQQEIVMWYRNNFCLSHHSPQCLIAAIPNGGNVSVQNRMTLLATGMMPGFADLIVMHRKTVNQPTLVIFVELKTDTGIMSSDQFRFADHVKSLGMNYILVRTLDQFQSFINGL